MSSTRSPHNSTSEESATNDIESFLRGDYLPGYFKIDLISKILNMKEDDENRIKIRKTKFTLLKELELTLLFVIRNFHSFSSKQNLAISYAAGSRKIVDLAIHNIPAPTVIAYRADIDLKTLYFPFVKNFYYQHIYFKYLNISQFLTLVSDNLTVAELQPFVNNYARALRSFNNVRFLAYSLELNWKTKKKSPAIPVAHQHLDFFYEYVDTHSGVKRYLHRSPIDAKNEHIRTLPPTRANQDTIQLFTDLRIAILSYYKMFDKQHDNFLSTSHSATMLEKEVYDSLQVEPFLYQLGWIYADQGDHQEQRDAIFKYIDFDATAEIGNTLNKLEKYAQFIAAYRIVLQLKTIAQMLSYQINQLKLNKRAEIVPSEYFQYASVNAFYKDVLDSRSPDPEMILKLDTDRLTSSSDNRFIAPTDSTITKLILKSLTKTASLSTVPGKTKIKSDSTGHSAPTSSRKKSSQPADTFPVKNSLKTSPAITVPEPIDEKKQFGLQVQNLTNRLANMTNSIPQMVLDYRQLFRMENFRIPTKTSKARYNHAVILGNDILLFKTAHETLLLKHSKSNISETIFAENYAAWTKLSHEFGSIKNQIAKITKDTADLTLKELREYEIFQTEQKAFYTAAKTAVEPTQPEVLSTPPISLPIVINATVPAKKLRLRILSKKNATPPPQPIVKKKIDIEFTRVHFSQKVQPATATPSTVSDALPETRIIPSISLSLAAGNSEAKDAIDFAAIPAGSLGDLKVGEELDLTTISYASFLEADTWETFSLLRTILALDENIHNKAVIHYALIFHTVIGLNSLTAIANLSQDVPLDDTADLRNIAIQYGPASASYERVRAMAEDVLDSLIEPHINDNVQQSTLYRKLTGFANNESSDSLEFKDDGKEYPAYIAIIKEILSTLYSLPSSQQNSCSLMREQKIKTHALFMLMSLCGELSLPNPNLIPELTDFLTFCRDEVRFFFVNNKTSQLDAAYLLDKLYLKLFGSEPENSARIHFTPPRPALTYGLNLFSIFSSSLPSVQPIPTALEKLKPW